MIKISDQLEELFYDSVMNKTHIQSIKFNIVICLFFDQSATSACKTNFQSVAAMNDFVFMILITLFFILLSVGVVAQMIDC